MKTRTIPVMVGLVASGTLLLSGCGEFRAERQGKQLGEAICDIKSAGSADDARRELEKAQREMNDLQRIVGRPINEDLSDIEENLDDLVEHAVDGNDALREQDIAVIQRNVDAVIRQLNDEGQAAYDGVQEGLAECDY